jgi:hypothetical protein
VLLDIGGVLAGIGIAVVGFVIVVLVCVVILRLLAAILPSYEDRSGPASEASPEDDACSPGDAPDDRESVASEAGPGVAAGDDSASS